MTNKDISKNLEYCASRKCELCQKENGSGFPLIDGRCYGMTERMYDAIAVLKAQEPRMMTLEEVKAYKVGEPLFYECKVIYPCWVIRHKDKNERIHFISYVGNIFKDISEYGIRWRCWASRPTDEQREATPWNAQK